MISTQFTGYGPEGNGGARPMQTFGARSGTEMAPMQSSMTGGSFASAPTPYNSSGQRPASSYGGYQMAGYGGNMGGVTSMNGQGGYGMSQGGSMGGYDQSRQMGGYGQQGGSFGGGQPPWGGSMYGGMSSYGSYGQQSPWGGMGSAMGGMGGGFNPYGGGNLGFGGGMGSSYGGRYGQSMGGMGQQPPGFAAGAPSPQTSTQSYDQRQQMLGDHATRAQASWQQPLLGGRSAPQPAPQMAGIGYFNEAGKRYGTF
jgi:hypothetical protein